MTLIAGIVAFHPDMARLQALLRALRPQVDGVILFVNGGVDAAHLAALRETAPELHAIHPPANLGVGEALNVLSLQAALTGATHVWLFDQDSLPPPDLAPRLSAELARLTQSGARPAMIAPRLTPPDAERAYKMPRLPRKSGVTANGTATPVLFAPTSGSLIALDVFRDVGPFRADFFIDGIDLEWGMRAWARGYSVWVGETATMVHRIGDGVEPLVGKLATPAQSEFRLCAYVRNTAALLRMDHPPLSWKAMQSAYLVAQFSLLWARRKFSPRFASAVLRAAADGFRGDLGPPPGARDAVPWRESF